MKKSLILWLMLVAITTVVRAEIITGYDKGVKFTYDADTKTIIFQGNGPMANYGDMPPYADGLISPFDYSGEFDIRVVILEKGITSVGSSYFVGQNINKVVFPEGLIRIGRTAFSGCDIDSLVIPSTITTIEFRSFRGNSNLVDLVLPDNLKTIESRAFEWCGLHSIVIPDSVSIIGNDAFADNSNLTNVKCNRNKKFDNIGTGIFRNCPLTHEVIFFDELVYVPKDVSEYVVPDYITTINDAFYGNTSLKSIYIPKSVTTLKSNCFNGCTSLKSVDIPELVTSIPQGCFSQCSSLEKIDLHEGLTTISSNAFRLTSIDTITVPPSVTSIGLNAFSTNKETTIFFWPLLDEGNYDEQFCNENAKLYLQDVDLEKHPDALSLNDYYIDANFNTSFDKIEITLNPKKSGIEIKGVSYRKEDADGYVSISPGTDGVYAFLFEMVGVPYFVKVDMTIDGLDRSLYYKIPTVFYPSYSYETTQTSITFKLTSLFDDVLDGYGIYRKSTYSTYYPADADGNVVVDNLQPGVTYDRFYTYGIYKGELYLSPDEYVVPVTTKQISLSLSTETSPTTIKAIGSYNHEEAKILDSGFSINGEFYEGDNVLITGLAPGNRYELSYVVNTEQGDSFSESKNITMPSLWLTTEPAKLTSKTSALLVATTNLDNAETNAGFQWRRRDAPDDMPSDYIKCSAVDGVMECPIRNLNPEDYYKYRPYYISQDGSEYFGEWEEFTTKSAGGIDGVAANSRSRLEVLLRNNPVGGGTAWVKVPGTSKKELTYTLTTLGGMHVGGGMLSVDGGWNEVRVPSQAGLYFITVNDGNYSATAKLIVR